uniref:Mitoguardin 2 n=1 Tax=Eptatretus burgeri TaxID=7764 RepID=A0A8C4QS55_EPTBU
MAKFEKYVEGSASGMSVFMTAALGLAELPNFIYSYFTQLRLPPGLRRLLLAGTLGTMVLVLTARHLRRRRGREKQPPALWEPSPTEVLNPFNALGRPPLTRISTQNVVRRALGPSGRNLGSSTVGLPLISHIPQSSSLQSLASIRSRHSSVCMSTTTPWNQSVAEDGLNDGLQRMFLTGMELFEEAMNHWEQALVCHQQLRGADDGTSDEIRLGAPDAPAEEFTKGLADREFVHKLERLLQRAHQLQEEFEAASSCHPFIPTHDKGDCILEGTKRPWKMDTSSIASDDSFVSAAELVELLMGAHEHALRGPPSLQHLDLYENGMQQVQDGLITCRTFRTELLGCCSDEDFLAKLHCVREAFRYMLEEETVRALFVETGRRIIAGLLNKAGKDPTGFVEAYEEMLRYSDQEDYWTMTQMELEGRGVTSMTFFDVVLDFIMMDAFEDLENPPSSVLAVVQNRWLSDSFKETALTTACWSVLKAKRSLLQVADGFMSRFYAISEHVSPVLAWGFLSHNEPLHQLCCFFKQQVLSLLKDMFDLEKVRYTTLEHLASDILSLFHRRTSMLLTYMENIHELWETVDQNQVGNQVQGHLGSENCVDMQEGLSDPSCSNGNLL